MDLQLFSTGVPPFGKDDNLTKDSKGEQRGQVITSDMYERYVYLKQVHKSDHLPPNERVLAAVRGDRRTRRPRRL